MTTAAAVVFALVIAAVVVFQLALARGAPWGQYAMGGRYPARMPQAARVAAVVQAAVLAVLAGVVLAAAGVILPSLPDGLGRLVWIPVAVSVLSLVLNVITPSAGERRIWAPVAAVLVASSLVVAMRLG